MAMPTIGLADAKENLDQLLDRVCAGHEAITVIREDGPPVVVIALADFPDETVRLLAEPANTSALRESLAQAERGEVMSFRSVEDALAAAEAELAARR
ncbi:MAG: type II toxin-antitoxin system Phd/YefM family antitoxin [Bryobacteraceae bacterium]|nr:type II toxin-antitoxin system Phd/YefM family antitoxin [Bryobacteraceae bacterium]